MKGNSHRLSYFTYQLTNKDKKYKRLFFIKTLKFTFYIMHIRIGDIVTKLGNMNIIFKIYLEFIFKYIWVHARIFVLTILGLILNLYKPHIGLTP